MSKRKAWRMDKKWIRLVCAGCRALMGVRLKPAHHPTKGRVISHGICDTCGPKLYPQYWIERSSKEQ